MQVQNPVEKVVPLTVKMAGINSLGRKRILVILILICGYLSFLPPPTVVALTHQGNWLKHPSLLD